ncbi:helix-turn-helix domain-containing protein [Fibrivirga algicola]|uniref:AraC family transcriptional regulator n=1 Tax=Fibrivirga algicola TaxID=2950420 RepID=A0ABX0QJW8_9BACT|nr:helix-turn-helix transcriptional regulator [Fibrivirga algicola]NID10938.1 AraC family transcriptional regulator [Fibrivirga algicola]
MASFHTYSLAQLLTGITGQIIGDYTFYLSHFTGQDKLIPHPYRIQGYAVGVPVSGWLEGSLNLDTFQVRPGQLMVIAPQQIHQILRCSPDFTMRTLFFTDAFLAAILRDTSQLATRSIFQPLAPAVITLSGEEWQRLTAIVDIIEQHYWPIERGLLLPVGHLVQAILTDLHQINRNNSVDTTSSDSKNRPAELTTRFRQLVVEQYISKRTLTDYADQLAVTAKHLSETVKQQTGKPASAWIDAMVVQEAQVLLSQTNSSISQIADYLQFGTQAAFGKFFRNKVGLSPRAYRSRQ